MKRRSRGELEALVMGVLWDSPQPMTPGEVLEAVSTARRPLAYTTVMTILVRLWEKGMLERRGMGRAYAYSPVATREDWTARRMHELLENSGDSFVALQGFVNSISTKEATELRRMLEERKP